MAVKIGVGLDARLRLPFDQLRQAALVAEALGFESAWTPAGGVPDAFHVCAAWASATRLDTGISVVPAARMWTPAALAVQAATVESLGAGTFVLGLGTGGYGEEFWRGVGRPPKPIAVMREYLVETRRLLATFRSEAPLGLACLGPQMTRLAGEAADVALLNWATPSQIAIARDQVTEGAARAGRAVDAVRLTMYVRVCVDDDVEAARTALGAQVLSYAMAGPGADPTLGYRGHFARMGFDEVLCRLEARRADGVSMADLVAETPDELLAAVGYWGPAGGAAEAYARLSVGLDETVVRIVTARPGLAPVVGAMEALTPARLRGER